MIYIFAAAQRQYCVRSAPYPMKLEEFRKLVKDALEHLYDTAYLEVHPLLTQLSGIATANRSTRAQELRSILKNAVEELRHIPKNLKNFVSLLRMHWNIYTIQLIW